jgi:hypothetical protein
MYLLLFGINLTKIQNSWMGHSQKTFTLPHSWGTPHPFRTYPSTFYYYQKLRFLPPPLDSRNFLCRGSVDLFWNDAILHEVSRKSQFSYIFFGHSFVIQTHVFQWRFLKKWNFPRFIVRQLECSEMQELMPELGHIDQFGVSTLHPNDTFFSVQVNVLSCLPDWPSCLATKSWASLSLCFHCRINIFYSACTWFKFCLSRAKVDLRQYNIAI